ncbi:MAG: hypothetical protein K2N56_11755 [Oscillospiraceae bacterium]|nr:hypothetical protein [Oscillospiraceae bacterium]
MVIPERLKEFAASDKGRKIMIAAALAVMLLLLLSSLSCGRKRNSEISVQAAHNEDISAMEKDLERRLERLLSEIEGVGSVSVMVTVDTSSRLIYDRNVKTEGSQQSSSDNFSESFEKQTEVVLAGSSKDPLQIGTVQPQVRGAAVVCSGASDPVIRERVANTVAKALNIGISRVYVTC